jgi:hypothetical protein
MYSVQKHRKKRIWVKVSLDYIFFGLLGRKRQNRVYLYAVF